MKKFLLKIDYFSQFEIQLIENKRVYAIKKENNFHNARFLSLFLVKDRCIFVSWLVSKWGEWQSG